MGDIDSINRQRTANLKSLQNILDNLNNPANQPFSLVNLERDKKRLETAEQKCLGHEFDAVKLCKDDAAVELQTQETEKFYKLFYVVENKVAEVYDQVVAANGNPNTGATAEIKLPRMELPSFSGQYTDWSSFHDLFKSIVHSSTKIGPAQKLHYLKSSLNGEAAELIKSIEITDANYQKAWDLLIARYDNKRKIILSHFKLLMNQEALKHESASGLRNLLDTTTKHLDALESLGIDTKGYDGMLVALILERLDKETRKQWQLHSPGSDFPKYEDVRNYLVERARALEDTCEESVNRHPAPSHQFDSRRTRPATKPGSSSYHAAPSSQNCRLCSESHALHSCPEFSKKTFDDRKSFIQRNRLCFNCLQPHMVSQCSSTSSCKKCNGRHHTLIHMERGAGVKPRESANSDSQAQAQKVSSNFGHGVTRSVLSTAMVNVKDSSGNLVKCRALLDNGSELSFITESLVQQLGVRRHKSDISVTGICGDVSGRSRGKVNLTLESAATDYAFTSELFILSQLSGHLPQEPIKRNWNYLDGFELADPGFHSPAKIDILLGADVYYQLIKDKTLRFKGRPSLYDTHLGWIVSGIVNSRRSGGSSGVSAHMSVTDIQSQLSKFWELEEMKDEPQLTPEEVDCENHFEATHSRDSTGRYEVALPFKNTDLKLGASKEQAISRWKGVERRLVRNPRYQEEYNKFMAEYLAMGHMELIPVEERKEQMGKSFYLPHHFVLKETSTSTKFRVVFDGSAQTTSKVSLNDVLMTGPKLQREIVDILVRFLFYMYVFTADISKFFRQVSVRPEDRDFQRILWRKDVNLPIEEYRLTTVTYGTGPGPYLASRALQQVGKDYAEELPIANQTVQDDTYVDDVMTGEHSQEAVLEKQAQLIELLKRGQFPLVKWVSNCPAVLEAVPPEHRETQLPLLLESDDSVKALGLYWNPASDQFFFKVNLDPVVKQVTKRTLLSDTAKLYDPLGWLAPVVIKAKMLFQGLWKRKLEWDEDLPEDLRNEWLTVRNGLFHLNELRIDRHVINHEESDHQLHGFCDASELAYAACVYIRSEDKDGTIKTRLICAKTKVAPVKVVSLPRLELCGAVLLARLLNRVSKIVNVPISSVHAWSDSTVVLDWLNDLPRTWTTFVANRVSEIQGLVPRSKWNHVLSGDNPADCATKGLTVRSLQEHGLWWYGPSWLKKKQEIWPKPYVNRENSHPAQERRKTVAVFTIQVESIQLPERISSLSKLKRVTAYCLRFMNNCRKKIGKQSGPLTPKELEDALLYWVRIAQSQEFAKEMEILRKNEMPKNMNDLRPFIDSEGLLRVGGRLSNSKLPYSQKHPLLLPQRHELTKKILLHEHLRQLHAGNQLMMATIAMKFWIVNARRAIRSCVRSCVKCFRFKADPMSQLMGNLPAQRLEPTRPFLITGVDYAGPFSLKTMKGRGGKIYKGYVALFVCFATKAIHIELVTELSTEAFLMAMKNFVARRGKPSEMHSDNATNFVGANNELKELYELFKTETHKHAVADHLAETGINWKFIPARAPHHGGLWEAGVKSAKFHMRRVIGDTIMTFPEMNTILHQIEACLNSRPITPLSTDPNDLSALTPGHFLIGDALTSVPEPDLTKLPENRLSRYQLVQQQLQHFWKRWNREYLHTLQQRTKWTEPGTNVDVGDLVLIKEDDLPPLKWKMARVVDKHPGKDNLTRVVTLKTATGQLKRDVRRICRLPVENC